MAFYAWQYTLFYWFPGNRGFPLLKFTCILCALFCGLAVALPVHADSPIIISGAPCFTGQLPNGPVPIVVKVQNFGKSVRGAIRVQAQTYSQAAHIYTYPIDLPTGSEKQLIVYPTLLQFTSNVSIDFDGPVRVETVNVPLSSNGDPQSPLVGMISDSPGDLASVRSTNQYSGPSINPIVPSPRFQAADTYCSPENAPDRAIGYSGLKMLVIGEGAERLTDDQWSAVREWVAGGGSLVLFGGAGSLPYLQNQQVSALCPMNDLRQETAASISFPKGFGGVTYKNVAVLSGSPKPGAFVQLSDGNAPLIVSRHYGVGLVTLVSFDPVSQPIRGVDGAPNIVGPIMSSAKARIDYSTLSNWYSQLFTGENNNGGPSGGNPFQIQLPQFSSVAWIFTAYFIIVIPITFFVLRRIGKLELTWITTPIVSILFAFVFYLFTADLYKAAMTHRTAGVLTISADDGAGRFIGFSEIFIPHGGSYDIAVPNAEDLEESPITTDYYNPPSTDPIETTDTLSGVIAKDFSVGNLAFRRFYYSQPIEATGAITAKLTESTTGISGQITNNTSLPISNVILTNTETMSSYAAPAIQPGQTLAIDAASPVSLPSILSNNQPSQMTQYYPTPLPPRSPATSPRTNMTGKIANSIYLSGDIPGASLGLQMGKDVSGDASVKLLTTLPVIVEDTAK